MTPRERRVKWLLAALAVAGMVALGLWGREDAGAQEPLYDGGATCHSATGAISLNNGSSPQTAASTALSPPAAPGLAPIAATAAMYEAVWFQSCQRTTAPTTDLLPRELHRLRVTKCRYLVAHLYDHPGRGSFLPYCAELVSYCEEIEREKGAPGFGGSWWEALVYGAANFSLRCYKVAVYPPSQGDDCTGPFDVKREPLVLDPVANMRHHVREQYEGWRCGYRDLGLCRYVMSPARPHDWDGGRFARTDRRHRECIARGYERGELP